MNTFLEEAKLINNEVIRYRRRFHENPEVGYDLPKTTEFVMSKLKEFGYKPEEIGKSGVVATIGSDNKGKTFLLRADMDALPVIEKTDLPFKSINNNMHACAHDMHAAMLLGAAKLLKNHENEIEGTVKLLFQPNEEGLSGAQKMIEAGVLENPKVDSAMALHVYSRVPTNSVICGLGTCLAGCTVFKIVVKGTGCHGAMPEAGVDPINIAVHIYLAAQEIISREVSAKESAVITFGKFVGGETHNVIPDKVVMEGTIRYLSKEIGDFLKIRLEEIVVSTAKLFRGEATFEEIVSVPPLNNDKGISNEVIPYIKDIVGENKVKCIEEGTMGSEDFASYTLDVPSVYFILGGGTEEEDKSYGFPLHHPEVKFNEKVLPTGVAMYTYSAIMWLKNNK